MTPDRTDHVEGFYARHSRQTACWSNPRALATNKSWLPQILTAVVFFRLRIRVVVQWLVCLAIVMVIAMAILPLAFLWLAGLGVKRPLYALGLLLYDMSRG